MAPAGESIPNSTASDAPEQQHRREQHSLRGPRLDGSRGGRRGPRGGRGSRGGPTRGGNPRSNSAPRPHAPSKPPDDAREPLPVVSKEPIVLQREGEANEAEVEAEVCFICASPVIHQSLTPCNHRTCHICALRLRALYKNLLCAHCRAEAKSVIFTDDSVKRFEDFSTPDFEVTDENLGINYTDREIYEDTLLLLRYNCPDSSCDAACFGWPDLHRHVRQVHRKAMCDLCTRNKKVFTHEHELYTTAELRKHERFGDDNPGAIDQTGFKGHPECGFCRKRFYGDDELYKHCREAHERCFICERRNAGLGHAVQPQYYINYPALEEHFRKDHYMCYDQRCMDEKFVVFESEMDLKAHQLEKHPNDLSRDARKDARRVDMAGFDYRTPFQEPTQGRDRRRRGRGDGGEGRGRDPNADPLPVSSAQPLRRDELAYQRQMAIQSAQSVSTRSFGGHLTASTPNPTPTPNTATSDNGSTTAAARSAPDHPLRTAASSARNPATTATQVSSQEQARHDSVLARASVLLHHDTSKLSSFRSRVSSYRNSELSASQFLDALLALFDGPTRDIGTLVKELAELHESEEKRSDLVRAWRDYSAVNEDYPSLPLPSATDPNASSSSSTGTVGGRRILKLKSATAQSSRSATQRERAWGDIMPSTSSSSSTAGLPRPSFPSLPTSSTSRVPWVGTPLPTRPAPNRTPHPPPSSSTSSLTTAGLAGGGSEAFPALPAAAKPNTNIFGLHRGSVKWDDRSAPKAPNPWGAVNGNTNTAEGEGEGDSEEATKTAGGGKKKGRQKQTLVRFG